MASANSLAPLGASTEPRTAAWKKSKATPRVTKALRAQMAQVWELGYGDA